MPDSGLPFKPAEASSLVIRPLALLCALLAVSCGPVGTPEASAVPVVLPSVGTSAQVVGVTDGDTLAVLMNGQQVKIRIHGIDAPQKGQPFGDASKRALSDLVFGREVVIVAYDKDRWGRTIAQVYLNEHDIGMQMVRDGMAWHFVRYARKDIFLASSERIARAAKRGLWVDPALVAPWDWRKRQLPRTGR